MVDYCTLAEAKSQINTRNPSGTISDDFLSAIITDCSREIDEHCDRHFYADYATRTFDALEDVYGYDLMLDEDLIGVTTITNGDSTTVSSSDYVLRPANENPKYKIRLKRGSSVSWTYQNDPEDAISVEGTWGYNDGTVPPEVIKRATIRLVAWRFSQRDAPFNTRGFPQVGMTEVPTAMPSDVVRMLEKFRRWSMGVPKTR